MFSYLPKNPNGLAFIADARIKSDKEVAENQGGCPVLDNYWIGRESLGKREWERTARATMFDYKEDLQSLDKQAAKALKQARKAELRAWLKQLQPTAVILLQTLSRSVEESDLSDTAVWSAINNPGSLAECFGTAFLGEDETYFIPIPNSYQYDWEMAWYIRRWMRMGLDIAKGKTTPLRCAESITHPTERALELLRGYLTATHISVDLETIPRKDTITAINLSDGKTAVSLPWHSYSVYPTGGQAALRDFVLGPACETAIRDILAAEHITKIGHNIVGFDLLEMGRFGLVCNGPIEDTMLMHRDVHPSYRHGLQVACATEYCVEPWKTMHKPVNKPKGTVEFWTAKPEALRQYGCNDAFHQFQLFNALRWKLG